MTAAVATDSNAATTATTVAAVIVASIATIRDTAITECKGLVGVTRITRGNVEDIAFDCKTRSALVLRLERERAGSTIEREELRSCDLTTYGKRVR